jgi:hypothetical protein
MRRYERELIDRCLDVLEGAIEETCPPRGAAVRLALWALRPYCTKPELERFWSLTEPQNPMYQSDLRSAAFSAIQQACRSPARSEQA